MCRAALLRALLLLAVLPAFGAARAQTLTVTGRCEYVDKGWSFDGWTGDKPVRSIRRADVSVLDGRTDAVLGTGSTEADGSFSIACVVSSLAGIKVRCEADTHHATGYQRLRVTTENDKTYAFDSAVMIVGERQSTLDAGTLTATSMSIGKYEGSPFNLLDCGVSAMDFVLGPLVGFRPMPQTLRLTWPSPGGTFTSGVTGHVGADDGYDDAVVLHELGHIVHDLWSGNDSLGGPHWFGDSDQEPRLAFSEGFATCFGGAVMNSMGREALYVDCDGAAKVGGVQLHLRLETVAPWANLCHGEADEVAVACTLFDLLDDEHSADGTPGSDDDGFVSGTSVAGLSAHAAWWSLFEGPLKQTVNLALQDAWDEWLLHYAADPHAAELAALYAARDIHFTNDDQEPDGTLALAVRLRAVTGNTWTDARTLYASSGDPPAPGTGDVDWYAVPLVKGDVIEVATRYPKGAMDAETECDPYVELYAPDGALAGADEDGGVGRNALLPSVPVTDTGTWLVKVGTHSGLRRYGRYELRVLYLSENHPPVIVSGPSAFPPVVRAGQTAMLSALATDPDGDEALQYAWSPLDGGFVAGDGTSVTFVPPIVLLPKIVRVQLIVSDSLGAAGKPAQVSVTVQPMIGGLCDGSASWLVLGTGKAGLGGTPALVGVGEPIVPSLGFAMQATGLTPLFPGFMAFGFSQIEAPFDGGTLYAAPDLLLPVVPNAFGELFIPLLLPPEPLLCGLSVVTQVVVPGDPGAAGAKHTALSNGLKVTFGD